MPLDAPRDVAVVTPWYPTRQVPFGGAFVQSMVEAVAPGCDRTAIYHCDGWGARVSSAQDQEIWHAHRQLLARGVDASPAVAGAEMFYVPVPVRVGLTFAQLASRYADALRIALHGKPIDAGVVHGHVGLRGGWPALENARPGARVFVTEHATFLDQVLAEPDSRAMYDQVIARCTKFFAVGELVRAPLLEAFPHHAGRIDLIPNPISFDLPRLAPVTELRRWLFMGKFSPRKGVDWLLEAFARCWAKDPDLTLTLAGGGALQNQLTKRAAELGVSEAVTIIESVPPDEALALLRSHDLLVHPSRFETFGMTIVEAIAAGMPVLVTRCGGPEETLAGIETAAGEMIPVEESPDAIVEGYWRLRDRFPAGVDLPLAADTLASRYGYEAVARAHFDAWFAAPSLVRATPLFPQAREAAGDRVQAVNEVE